MNKCKWFYGIVTKEGETEFGSVEVPTHWCREHVLEAIRKTTGLVNVVSTYASLDAEEIFRIYGTDMEIEKEIYESVESNP